MPIMYTRPNREIRPFSLLINALIRRKSSRIVKTSESAGIQKDVNLTNPLSDKGLGRLQIVAPWYYLACGRQKPIDSCFSNLVVYAGADWLRRHDRNWDMARFELMTVRRK